MPKLGDLFKILFAIGTVARLSRNGIPAMNTFNSYLTFTAKRDRLIESIRNEDSATRQAWSQSLYVICKEANRAGGLSKLDNYVGIVRGTLKTAFDKAVLENNDEVTSGLGRISLIADGLDSWSKTAKNVAPFLDILITDEDPTYLLIDTLPDEGVKVTSQNIPLKLHRERHGLIITLDR